MRSWIAAAMLVGCVAEPVGDTGATDPDTADTGVDSDTAVVDTDTGVDTDTDTDTGIDTDTGTDTDTDTDTDTGGDTDTDTDVGDVDSDGDGLTDADEATLGTDPRRADTDGDGWSDGDEVRESTDPLDANYHPYLGGWPIDHACRTSLVATGTAVGDVAANFTLSDQHGESLRLWDFCGKAVLIDFTAFW